MLLRGFGVLLIVMAAVNGWAGELQGSGWRHVRTIGLMDFVLIDKGSEFNRDVYQLAFGKICGHRQLVFCKVLFWSDAKLVPAKMPMTDAQVAGLRANFTYNSKTGARSIMWSCDIAPPKDREDGACFSRD